MSYNLPLMIRRRRKSMIGAINPTKHHEAALRRLILSVIKLYEDGETEIIEATLSAGRLGMPIEIQTTLNQIKADVMLPRDEAIRKLSAWASSVEGWHNRRWQARVMAAVNIDVTPLTRSETIGPALRDAISDSTRLIRDVADDTATRIEKAALEAFESGEGKTGLAKKLREVFGYSRRRADLIAQDQLGKLTGKLDELRQTEAGIDSYQWLTVGDGRVRPTHAARNGEEFRWSDPPLGGPPGTEVRCLPASSVLDLTQGSDRLWRRLYRGPMVSVLTNQGRNLKATPNHPVLTQRGWIAIGDVQQGDYLVHCRIDKGPRGPDHAYKHQTSIGDLFEALARANDLSAGRLSDFDFHGDVTDHEVDVVNTDRLLMNDGDAEGAERIAQLLFPWAYSLGGVTEFDVSGLNQALASYRRGAVLSHALMGVLEQIRALIRTEAGHPQDVGSGAIADRYPSFGQDALQCRPGNAVLAGQLQHALSGDVVATDRVIRQICAAVVSKKLERRRGVVPGDKVLAKRVRAMADSGGSNPLRGPLFYELDRVTDLRVIDFRDHVFNLQTTTGWYTADGLVVHNCRCRARAVIPGMNRWERGET